MFIKLLKKGLLLKIVAFMSLYKYTYILSLHKNTHYFLYTKYDCQKTKILINFILQQTIYFKFKLDISLYKKCKVL